MEIHRKLVRKFKLHRTGSSFPFLSGDTYASLCDISYSGNDLSFSKKIDAFPFNQQIRVFVPLYLYESFSNWVDGVELDLSSFEIFLHNGDELPSEQSILKLSKIFSKIWAVNWIGDIANVAAIPIGLENRKLHTNGVPRDFRKLVKRGIPSSLERKNQILVSFSITTNPTERTRAIESLRNVSEIEIVNFQGKVNEYQQELLRSRFVLSPPGNGIDCHRTWEALYLGAIPIVKRKFWPFAHLDLPVVILDDWDDISELHNLELPDQVSIDLMRSTFLDI
jgi:hypothetical protein